MITHDPNRMAATAATREAQAQDLREAFAELIHQIARLGQAWTGSAATAAFTSFAGWAGQMHRQTDLLVQAGALLSAQSDRYRRVEQKAAPGATLRGSRM